MSLVEKRLAELGYVLPANPKPLANYVTTNKSGNLLYTSGSGCFVNGKPFYQGRVGDDLTVEQGYDAAKLTVLNLFSMIKGEIGDLDRIRKVVKLLGFVNSSPDFFDQPAVMDGASDFLHDVLSEKGRHARSAIGTSVLPMNLPVEIELIVEIETDEEE
ncbi:RidA family protein [Bacillus fonticola]|uniref:RidA family protein n=1 Tax=Bacillus fonticola TaxID=2728853 RepID=UPI001475D24B|nr:RidA family protein [Bacillus fonticola]